MSAIERVERIEISLIDLTTRRKDTSLKMKAVDGIRTHDLFLTKEVLYQLSYNSLSAIPKKTIRFIGDYGKERVERIELS
jgi:hypothetical protein